MGFGHRVYRAEDPRARVLRRTCKELKARRCYEAADALEKAAQEGAAVSAARTASIETNVEFWAAAILDFAEVPPHMMPAMFTMCPHRRLVRSHHRAEEAGNKLVRPAALYIGPGSAQARRGRGLGPHLARLIHHAVLSFWSGCRVRAAARPKLFFGGGRGWPQ